MKCQLCKEELFLPRRCSYCRQYFCDDHRLPEKHLCPALPSRKWGKGQKPRKRPAPSKRIRAEKPRHVGQSPKENRKEMRNVGGGNRILNKVRRISYLSLGNYLIKVAFLIVISLPVLDSIQLMWDSPMTFSRTFLPKWWDLFPSEYPTPSINLLLVYGMMIVIFFVTMGIFVSKLRYRKYDPRRIKIRHYIYIITVGSIFLYFFSEARLFWMNSFINFVYRINGG